MSIRIENIQVDNLSLGEDKVLNNSNVETVTSQIGATTNNYYYGSSGTHVNTGTVLTEVINEIKNLTGYTKVGSGTFIIDNTMFPKMRGSNATSNTIYRTRTLSIGTSSYGFLSHAGAQRPTANIEITNDNLQTITTYTNESIIRTGTVGTTIYTLGSSWNDLSNPGRCIFYGAGLRTISSHGNVINLICYDGTQWREIWNMPTSSISSSLWLIPGTTSGLGTITYQNGVITIPTNNYIRYWTDNFGESWQLCTNAGGGPPTDFQIHRTSNGIFYIYQVNGGRYSDTDGRTWKSITNFPNTPTITKTNHLIDYNPIAGVYVYVPDGPNIIYNKSVNDLNNSVGSWSTANTGVFITGSARHVYWCEDLFFALNNQNYNITTGSVATSYSGSTGWTLRSLSGANGAFAPNYAMKFDNRYWVFSDNMVMFASASNLNSWSIAYTIPSNDSITNGSDKQIGSVVRNTDGFMHSAGIGGVYFYSTDTRTFRSASSTTFTSNYETLVAPPTNAGYIKIR